MTREEYLEELFQIDKQLSAYADFIAEIFETENEKQDYADGVHTLCILVCEDDNFIRFIEAYYELYDARRELEQEMRICFK